MKKTKIICTLGPSCSEMTVLQEMIRSGMNVARLNMAHGELEEHSQTIQKVRQAANEMNTYVPILMDVKGPEIRLGKLKEAGYELRKGDSLCLTTQDVIGDSKRVSVTYGELPSVLSAGCTILLDDGMIELSVTAVDDRDVQCTVLNDGLLKPRKGINLPGISTTLPGVTERDIAHIRFGLGLGIDMIAMSFVRKAEDIEEVRELLAENNAAHVQIIAKIENMEGMDRLEEIVQASDGIMVARGDLGVEIPMEDVPLAQLQMIERCREAGKPVIIATHLLESMQLNPRPTRAEVSDVGLAVMQGADVIMLSGESAAGAYPVQSTATLASIALKAESRLAAVPGAHSLTHAGCTPLGEHSSTLPADAVQSAIGHSAALLAADLNAKAIITPAKENSLLARMLAKHRPQAPIIAVTDRKELIPALALLRGVLPLLEETCTEQTAGASIETLLHHAVNSLALESGDHVIYCSETGLDIIRLTASHLNAPLRLETSHQLA